MKKIIYIALYIIAVLIGIFAFFTAYKSYKIQSEYGSFEGTASTGGNLAEGVIVDVFTGIIDSDIELTDIDTYHIFLGSGNYRSFYPGYQGSLKGSYSNNSDLMNQYLTKNTFQFNLPYKPNNGYLYIKLKKPTENRIFVYRYQTKIDGYTVSGDLDKKNSLIDSDSELLFKLDNISYIPYHKTDVKTFDRLKELKQGNQNFIAGFVRDYNGSNKIEEITIAWE